MTDKNLRDNIIAALDWEPSIDASDIGVTTERGVVTLTGHVPNYWQRLTAENIVKRVKGVKGLVQKIDIRPPASKEADDEQIALRAVNSLNWSVNVPKEKVQLQVKNGVVTLRGEVEWHYQRMAAEQSIRALDGVRGVQNLISIKVQPTAPDIKLRIENALRRDAELEAKGITVEVDRGKVTLRGTVSDWHDKDVLETAVWSAPGVQSVDDRVVVD